MPRRDLACFVAVGVVEHAIGHDMGLEVFHGCREFRLRRDRLHGGAPAIPTASTCPREANAWPGLLLNCRRKALSVDNRCSNRSAVFRSSGALGALVFLLGISPTPG